MTVPSLSFTAHTSPVARCCQYSYTTMPRRPPEGGLRPSLSSSTFYASDPDDSVQVRIAGAACSGYDLRTYGGGVGDVLAAHRNRAGDAGREPAATGADD